MRFIHIADVHLSARPDKGKAWSEERADEIWQSLQRIIYEANRQDVDLLLIAGDLFHGQPLIRDLKEVNYLFQKLHRAQVVLIMGNHDYLKKGSPCLNFSWNENVTCLFGEELESVCYPEYETTVYGLSYYEKEIQEAKLEHIRPEKGPGCHILLAHGGDENHMPFDKRKLDQAGFHYVALGHIHKPEILIENRMAYAGALEPIDQNDVGHHGYILGECRKGKVRIQFIPFASREYIHLEIPSSTSMTDRAMQELIEAKIRERGTNQIYKIRITGYRDADIEYQIKRYEHLGNIVDIQDDSEPDYDFEELYHNHKEDVIGRYIERLCQENGSFGEVQKQALYYGIRALTERE